MARSASEGPRKTHTSPVRVSSTALSSASWATRTRLRTVRLWKILGLAGLTGVAATGVVLARNERQRRAHTPDAVPAPPLHPGRRPRPAARAARRPGRGAAAAHRRRADRRPHPPPRPAAPPLGL